MPQENLKNKKFQKNIDDGKLMLPKVDFVFKKIFGDEKNKGVLMDFLSSILKIKKENIKDIKIKDPAVNKEYDDDKQGCLDVRLEMTDDNDNIAEMDIEIQLEPHKGMARRILSYWSNMYLDNFEEGMQYDELRKTISIIIFDKDFVPLKRYHTRFHVWEDEERYLFDDALEIHVLEIQKALRQQNNSNKDDDLFNWLLFMDNDSEEVCDMLTAANPAIGEAITLQRALSMDKDMRRIYTRRKMAISDEVSKLAYAREDGFKDGEQKGFKDGERAKSISMAKNLLFRNIPMDLIAETTGLSEKELKQLR